MTMKKKISCPTCGKKDTWTPDNSFRPFCSERCKLIDLGEWATGSYNVSWDAIDPEQLPDDNETS